MQIYMPDEALLLFFLFLGWKKNPEKIALKKKKTLSICIKNHFSDERENESYSKILL